MDEQARIYRSILHRTSARYITVRPQGLVLDEAGEPVPVLDVSVLEHRAARTLYRDRRQICRSLDAVTAVDNPRKHCQACASRGECTEQILVTLHVGPRPYRLLLSYSSATNFLLYVTRLRRQHMVVEDVETRIRVEDRGTWGEVRFHQAR